MPLSLGVAPYIVIMDLQNKLTIPFSDGERGGSVVECRTPEREVRVRDLPPPCCVLEQDTLLPESTG